MLTCCTDNTCQAYAILQPINDHCITQKYVTKKTCMLVQLSRYIFVMVNIVQILNYLIFDYRIRFKTFNDAIKEINFLVQKELKGYLLEKKKKEEQKTKKLKGLTFVLLSRLQVHLQKFIVALNCVCELGRVTCLSLNHFRFGKTVWQKQGINIKVSLHDRFGQCDIPSPTSKKSHKDHKNINI